jgi:8-hydroxy-5-deazaflavin:NADPH oxidoreductase
MQPFQMNKDIVLAILGGTGKEGTGLALRWAMAGFPIIIGSRQLEKARAAAEQLNEKLGSSTDGSFKQVVGMENAAAARAAQIIILTIVQAVHDEALEGLKEDLQGKLVIDTTARVDFRDPRPPAPPSAGRRAQEILGPGVKVAAAFQNIPAHALKKNLDQSLGADVLVCADDPEVAQAVIELSLAGGMRALYAGSLDNAVVVEGLTALLISLNQQYGVKTAAIQVTGLPV